MPTVIADRSDVLGVPTDGCTIRAYKASRFGSPPALGTPAPGAADAGPLGSGPANGQTGGVRITVPTLEDYYVSFQAPGGTVLAWGGPYHAGSALDSTVLHNNATAESKPGTLTVPVWDKGGAVRHLMAYGADNTGVGDSTAAFLAAIAAMPANGGGTIMSGEGTFKFDTISLPAFPKVVNIEGAGEYSTTFTPLLPNKSLFNVVTGAGTADTNVIGGFTAKAHTGGSTVAAFNLQGCRQTEWHHILFADSPTVGSNVGIWAKGFTLAAWNGGPGSAFCFSNHIHHINVENQIGPTTVISFENGGTGNAAYNANITFLDHLFFYNGQSGAGLTIAGGAPLATGIDAGDSGQTIVKDYHWEAMPASAVALIPGNQTVWLGGYAECASVFTAVNGLNSGVRSVAAHNVWIDGVNFFVIGGASWPNLNIGTGLQGWRVTVNGGTTVADNGTGTTIRRDNGAETRKGAHTFTQAVTGNAGFVAQGAANALTAAGSATTAPVTLTATGTDATIGANLVAKGAAIAQLVNSNGHLGVGAGGSPDTTAGTSTVPPAAGGAGALPATPKGYMSITINGVAQQIPYY